MSAYHLHNQTNITCTVVNHLTSLRNEIFLNTGKNQSIASDVQKFADMDKQLKDWYPKSRQILAILREGPNPNQPQRGRICKVLKYTCTLFNSTNSKIAPKACLQDQSLFPMPIMSASFDVDGSKYLRELFQLKNFNDPRLKECAAGIVDYLIEDNFSTTSWLAGQAFFRFVVNLSVTKLHIDHLHMQSTHAVILTTTTGNRSENDTDIKKATFVGVLINIFRGGVTNTILPLQ